MNRQLLLLFAATGIGFLMQTMDITAMNVALSAIETEFDSTLTTIEWVISGYLLAFSVFLVTGGRLADMFGRKKLFLISLLIFAASSLSGGLAQSDLWLIVSRIFQGIGAAIMWPCVIGMINYAVPEDKKGLSVGILFGIAGLGQSIGPINGGAFAEFLSWRWILLINIPFSILAAFITLFYLKIEDPKETDETLDYPGITILSLGLFLLMFTFNQSDSWGLYSPLTISLLILSAILIWAFLRVEKKASSALIPPDLMRLRGLMVPCIIIAFITPGGFTALLYLPQYMEQYLGFSSFEAGLALVPAMVTWTLSAPVGGKFYNRFGPKIIILIASLSMGVSTLLFSFTDAHSDYIWFVPGILLLGFGLGIGLSSLTTAGVSAVDKSRSSLAGAIVHMFQIGIGGLGLVLATSIYTYISRSKLSSSLSHFGTELDHNQLSMLLSGTNFKLQFIEKFSPQTGSKIASAIQESFISGMQGAMLFVSLISFAGALITLAYIRRIPPTNLANSST